MSYKRLIPVLLIKDGLLVRSQLFKYHQAIGDPIPTIKRLSDWLVDELIILNIGQTTTLDSRRSDKYHNLGTQTFVDLIDSISTHCQMPLTVGGGISSMDMVDRLFRSGADKISINTELFVNPQFCKQISQKYGNQALVASIDVKNTDQGKLVAFTNGGSIPTKYDLESAIQHAIDHGCGEVLISSIENDGSGKGYNKSIMNVLEFLKPSVPVIINSGPINSHHFIEGFANSGVSACAASNTFYFTELSYPIYKQNIKAKYSNIRIPDLAKPLRPREPEYSEEKKSILLKKLYDNSYFDKDLYRVKPVKPRYCTRCMYSSFSASPIQFNKDGLCMGCVVSDQKLSLTDSQYLSRQNQLKEIIDQYKSKSGCNSQYDCIVSVSGGKDSYYQTHFVKNILGLNPLLVTYDGNNFSQEGWQNLTNMKSSFDCDHIIVSPSVNTLKKLNKLAFAAMGDMNWHNHVGIYTTAPRIAVQMKIPIIFGVSMDTLTYVVSFQCKTFLK